MILGLGSDMADARRIEALMERYAERFAARVFTESERRLAASRPAHRIATLTRRFAAKEACLKALGTGLSGIHWREVEIYSHPSGQPGVLLHGAAKAREQAMLPEGTQARWHLTLSDEPPYAVAFAVLEAH